MSVEAVDKLVLLSLIPFRLSLRWSLVESYGQMSDKWFSGPATSKEVTNYKETEGNSLTPLSEPAGGAQLTSN